MRIIGGEHRSRRLKSPPDTATARPMPAMVKEALFTLLRGHYDDAGVLDLFAGSGAIGLEAVSRGARECVFVEKERASARVIEDNIAELGVQDRCRVISGDALGASIVASAPRPLHLVFMDPPYALMENEIGRQRVLSQASRLIRLLDDDGFLVLRTPWPMIRADKTTPSLAIDDAVGPETHAYGTTAIHLYAKAGVAHADERAPVDYVEDDGD